MFNQYKIFFSDAMTLIGATTLAKIVGVLMVPIVTRLYNPDDFGVVAMILSISVIFGTVSALRYDQAIVLPKDDLESMKLVQISLILVFFTGLMLLLVVFIVISYITGVVFIDSMGNWLYAVPLIVVLSGGSEVLSHWCTRKTDYKLLGSSEVSVSFVLSGTRILYGFYNSSSVFGLILGNILSLISKVAILTKKISFKDLCSRPEKDGATLMSIGKKYSEFPIYSAPTGILNSSFQVLPVIMLGIFFVPSVVGLYAMASRITKLPIDIISMPIRRIYVQRIAKLRNENKAIKGILIKTTLGLAAIGIIPFAVIAFFGEELFSFVLGDKWGQAGIYASILVPWLFSVFAITPSSSNFVVLKKQALWFRIQLFNAAAGLSSFVVGGILGMSVESLLLMFSVLGVCVNAIAFFISLSITTKLDACLSECQ